VRDALRIAKNLQHRTALVQELRLASHEQLQRPGPCGRRPAAGRNSKSPTGAASRRTCSPGTSQRTKPRQTGS
jgi:hypothetical protein